jgi:hypothetical protein
MSSTRHAVTRGPSFTGFGKRPVLTPSHQQDFFTGIIGGIGGSALGSPKICGNRRKPVSGSWFMCCAPRMSVAGQWAQNNFPAKSNHPPILFFTGERANSGRSSMLTTFRALVILSSICFDALIPVYPSILARHSRASSRFISRSRAW